MSLRFSVTLRFGATAVSWGERLICGLMRFASVSTDSPSKYALPLVGLVNPHSIEIVVVLPAPFTPSNAKVSPCATVRLSLSTAVRLPKVLVRSTVHMASIPLPLFRFRVLAQRMEHVGKGMFRECLVPVEITGDDH